MSLSSGLSLRNKTKLHKLHLSTGKHMPYYFFWFNGRNMVSSRYVMHKNVINVLLYVSKSHSYELMGSSHLLLQRVSTEISNFLGFTNNTNRFISIMLMNSPTL